MKLHDLIFCIREVGVDEVTWEAIQKEAKEKMLNQYSKEHAQKCIK